MDQPMFSQSFKEIESATGFKRGALTEIFGERSSGKTGLILSILAAATSRQNYCAFIDATDSFDPVSARAAGVMLARVLWVTCKGKLEAALKSTDYLLNAGGFRYVLLDLTDVRPEIISRVPYSYWFRFRLAAEKTQTVFLLVTPVPCAGSSSSVSVQCTREQIDWIGAPEFRLLHAIYSKNIFWKGSKMTAMLKAQDRPAGNGSIEKTASSF